MRLLGRLLCLWLTVFGLAGKATAQSPYIITGDANHPPFSFIDEEGKPSGFYYEIVKAVLDRMKDEFQTDIQLEPWKRAVRSVETGQSLGLFPPHYFPDKRPFLSAYSDPIMAEQPVLYCDKSVMPPKGSQWPEDYKHLTIGLSAGVKMGGDDFWTLKRNNAIQTIESAGVRENLKRLFRGRVDCHINDYLTIEWMAIQVAAEEEGETSLADFGVATKVSPKEHGYLALSRDYPLDQAAKDRFLNRFNLHLSTLREEGVINTIIHRYAPIN